MDKNILPILFLKLHDLTMEITLMNIFGVDVIFNYRGVHFRVLNVTLSCLLFP